MWSHDLNQDFLSYFSLRTRACHYATGASPVPRQIYRLARNRDVWADVLIMAMAHSLAPRYAKGEDQPTGQSGFCWHFEDFPVYVDRERNWICSYCWLFWRVLWPNEKTCRPWPGGAGSLRSRTAGRALAVTPWMDLYEGFATLEPWQRTWLLSDRDVRRSEDLAIETEGLS